MLTIAAVEAVAVEARRRLRATLTRSTKRGSGRSPGDPSAIEAVSIEAVEAEEAGSAEGGC